MHTAQDLRWVKAVSYVSAAQGMFALGFWTRFRELRRGLVEPAIFWCEFPHTECSAEGETAASDGEVRNSQQAPTPRNAYPTRRVSPSRRTSPQIDDPNNGVASLATVSSNGGIGPIPA